MQYIWLYLGYTVPWVLATTTIRTNSKKSACSEETRVRSLGGKILWRREKLPAPVFLPGEFHGQWSLVGYSPWGHQESDTTEQRMLSSLGHKTILLPLHTTTRPSFGFYNHLRREFSHLLPGKSQPSLIGLLKPRKANLLTVQQLFLHSVYSNITFYSLYCSWIQHFFVHTQESILSFLY